ncbi:MAG: hypothetical protein AAGA48_19340 [Myxococcota bacterium]
MSTIVGLAWAVGCGTSGGGGPAPDRVDPVPTGERPEVIEVETFGCYSETVIDDRLLGGTANRVYYRGYDDTAPEPLRVYQLCDLDGDGFWDRRERWFFDDRGLQIRYERDLYDPRIDTSTYDDRGNEVRWTRDDDGDGTTDYVRESTWDAQDREVLRTIDEDADGTIDRREETVWSDDGRTKVKRFYRVEALEEIQESAFDEQGRLVEFRRDDLLDSAYDRVITRTYSDDGRTTVETFDEPADGVPEWIETNVRDAHGLRVATDAARSDGEVYRYERLSYDPEGRLLRSFWANDEIEKTSESTYTYDARGRTLERYRRVESGDEVWEDELSTTTYHGTCP